MAERCKHLDARIAQLEADNKNLSENVGKDNAARPSSSDVKAHVSAQVNMAALQKKVAELETENAELQHAMKSRPRYSLSLHGGVLHRQTLHLQNKTTHQSCLLHHGHTHDAANMIYALYVQLKFKLFTRHKILQDEQWTRAGKCASGSRESNASEAGRDSQQAMSVSLYGAKSDHSWFCR